jgi:hypothetical protein
MDKLKEFFKNNDVRIGEGKDFTTTPPIYYSSLNDAFRNYFLTFRDKKDTFHFVLDIKTWSRQSLAFNYSGANDNIVFSILGFHRFIELLLKDILRRINPYLAVKFLEKEEELFQYLDNKISADEIKTIEFSETLKRFKQAFKHYDKTSEVYIQHLQSYEFLLNLRNIETLNRLSEWRNRIMHNGMTLPNLFAFEYLVSQRLIPLIDVIIKAEKKYLNKYLPHFFTTLTGINVIDEILSVKFEFSDFEDASKSKSLAISLLKLGHLKEIGRAAFNHDIVIRNNISFYEPYYENPIGRVERFAEAEKLHKDFYNLRECICCGVKSLVVYRKSIDIHWTEDNFISWFKCYNCDYSLKNNVGDPNFFNLSERPIFATE